MTPDTLGDGKGISQRIHFLTVVRNREWVSGPSRAFEIYLTRWASN